MSSVEKGTLIEQHTTDTLVETRTLKTEITDGPVIEQKQKTFGYGPQRGTTRTYRYQIRSVIATLETGKPWRVTVGIQRVKKDGMDAQMSRKQVGAYYGWSLHKNTEILEFRDRWLAEQGIGLDQIQPWSR